MKGLQKKQQFVREALNVMDQMFSGYPLTELVYKTPFQLLVAVIMSAQTTDKQVNKVNEQFFRFVSRPEDIVALGEAGVGEMIRTVGLWKSKTVHLVKMAGMIMKNANEAKYPKGHKSRHVGEKGKMKNVGADNIRTNIREQQRQYTDANELYEERGYRIPDVIEEMVELPGVGIKTAKVVLYILYGKRFVAVDTHVHRVMNRLGIVDTKTPEQSSVLLEQIIPDDCKPLAHKVIIYFGRYHCTAKKPHCEECSLSARCPFFQKIGKTGNFVEKK